MTEKMATPDITLYTLPSSTGWLVAKHADTTWSIFPAVAGGWGQRRDWHPDPAYAQRVEFAHNGIQLIYRAELLEIPHQLRWFGIDPARCAPTQWA